MKYINENRIAAKRQHESDIEVSDEVGAELLAAQNDGHKIVIRTEGPRILDKERRTVYAEDGSRKQIATNDDTPDGYSDEPPEPTEVEQRELDRLTAKRTRDQALQAITHEWPDGSVVQVRPQDRHNLREAIQEGTPLLWVLADNTSRETTPEELQAALDAGTRQAKAIWAIYAARLNELNAV